MGSPSMDLHCAERLVSVICSAHEGRKARSDALGCNFIVVVKYHGAGEQIVEVRPVAHQDDQEQPANQAE